MADMHAPNVFLVPHNLRSAISWGGYSIVNATLSSDSFLPLHRSIFFTFHSSSVWRFVRARIRLCDQLEWLDISDSNQLCQSLTFPSLPLNSCIISIFGNISPAIPMESTIVSSPGRVNPLQVPSSSQSHHSPSNSETWHYFVECDNALHRIARLPPVNLFPNPLF